MYYGKYDYYILAEGSKEITPTLTPVNYNENVLYGLSKKKYYLLSTSTIKTRYESLNNDISHSNMKEVVMK